jgi:transposase
MCDSLAQLFQLDGINNPEVVIDPDGRIRLLARLAKERQDCPRCESNNTVFRGSKDRQFHLPPIGSKRATLIIHCRRNHCRNCRHTWWPSFSFSQGKARMTNAFANHALDLMKMGTIKDVAEHLGVSWDTIKDLHKSHLEQEYAEIPLADIEYLSVDEFSIKKGHTYMTVFSDVKTGRVVHAVEGRKKKDIYPFLNILKKKVPVCVL